MKTENPMRALLPLALAFSSCTDTDLYTAVNPDPTLPRAGITAMVCGPPQEVLPMPYKILFVIDTSASTLINETDPPLYMGMIDTEHGVTRRETAVRNAISAHLSDPNFTFGIITFNDFPQVQTFGFTRDGAALDAAVRNIGLSTGWTNYSDTLVRADEMIESDIARSGPTEALRSHYLVFFISDGYPTRGITDDDPMVLADAIDRGVSYLIDNAKDRVAEIRFNTAFLGGGKPLIDPTQTLAVQMMEAAEWDTEASNARALLKSMAMAGNGTFTDIPAGQAFDFPIDAKSVMRHYVIAPEVAASNLNVTFIDRPLTDSDADGLDDDDDPQPLNPDADGDGLRDGVEALMPSSADPLDPTRPGACAQPLIDSDGDGLNDCEEALIGTSPMNVDSDGDRLTDFIEVFGHASAVSASRTDSDGDGVNDDVEVRSHLNPREANDPSEVTRWSYQYQVERQDTRGDGSTCYKLTVSNLALLETAAVGARPVGQNTVELIVPFWAEDSPDVVVFYRSRVQGIFRAPDFLEPTSGTMVIQPNTFQKVAP
jgi:hypothetical protein